MTFVAFSFVFFSVFLHVAWNMLSKGTRPSVTFYCLMSLTASCLWLPFFLMSNISFLRMPFPFLLLVAGSLLGEVLYMVGLACAYRRGDISFVYPVVRALPVMMVAVVTMIFGLGKALDAYDLFGMLLISAGCLFMPLRGLGNFSLKAYCSSVVFFILVGAAGTTMYTIFDSCALKIVREAAGSFTVIDTLAYLFIIEFGQVVCEMFFIVSSRRERTCFRHMFCRSVYPVLAGLCSSSAYALVLFAMGYVTNVSYLQAFRQISLPVGFFAGVLILHEKAYATKLAGVFIIAAGLLVMIFF